MTGPAVVTDGLGKLYRRRPANRANWALRDCTLEVPAGRICGLVGANGAGKTTLLKLLVGLTRPTAGTVQVLDRRPSDSADFLREVGHLAQEMPLYRRWTVADHLAMGARLNPAWDAATARDRIDGLGIKLDQRVARRAEQIALDCGFQPVLRQARQVLEAAAGAR